jgi:hypothetical protein
MSEINREIPEGVTQKATIIDFEAARGNALKKKLGMRNGFKSACKNSFLQAGKRLLPLLLPLLQKAASHARRGAG